MGAGDAAAAQRVDGQLRHDLGLGARHEDARADAQLEVAEGRDAGDVLQRLARRAARDERLERRGGGVVERVAAHRGRLDRTATGAEHVPGEQLGIDLRIGHAGARELLRGAAEHVGERGGTVG